MNKTFYFHNIFQPMKWSSSGEVNVWMNILIDNRIKHEAHKEGTKCYYLSMYCLFFQNVQASMNQTINSFFKSKTYYSNKNLVIKCFRYTNVWNLDPDFTLINTKCQKMNIIPISQNYLNVSKTQTISLCLLTTLIYF